MAILRAVIDTNIMFEGLSKAGTNGDFIVQAWINQFFQPCVSDTLVYEYLDVFSRKFSATRWQKIEPVLQAMLKQSDLAPIFYKWRPSTPDVGDDHVVDTVMNASALLVTYNLKDFKKASQELGFQLLSPAKFIKLLAEDN